MLKLDIITENYICCCMKKTKENNFMSEEEFNKLPLVVEEGDSFNDRHLYPYAYNK